MYNKIYYNFFLILLTFTTALILNTYVLPHEDAAILFRYSENFSSTGVISYNLNEQPTEGATDFLWMVILAILNKLGLDTYFSAIVLNFLALITTSNIITERFKLNNFYILIIFFIHFSFPFFLVGNIWIFPFVCRTFLVLFLLNILENNIKKILFYSFIGTLIRPDFFFFIFFINLYFFYKSKLNQKLLFIFYIVMGLIYFFSRYLYFGELFPLPFYVKTQWIILENLGWLKQIIFLTPFILYLMLVDKKLFKCKNNYYFNISNYYSNNLLYESTTLSKLWSKILFLLLSSFLVTLFLKYNSAKIYLNFCTILSVCLLSILINFKLKMI